MKKHFPHGFTLLETVLYIGIFAVIFPAFTLFVLHVWQQQIGFDARVRLEQTTSLLFLETSRAITEANAVDVTSSVIETDSGSLMLHDENGMNLHYTVVSTTQNFSGTDQTVHRLQVQHGSDAPLWLTDPELDVTQWRIDAVRNTAHELTGLRLSINAALINSGSSAYRNATFAAQATFALSPNTIEL